MSEAAASRHPYRTEIPNMVFDMGLSVYALCLYAYIKRVAGDKGECFQKVPLLAKACNMSVGSVTNAKRELLKAGLIEIAEVGRAGGTNHDITVVDIWDINTLYCQERSRNERFFDGALVVAEGSEDELEESFPRSVHHMNALAMRSQNEREHSPHESVRSSGERVRSCGETKKTSLRRPLEELKTSSPYPSDQQRHQEEGEGEEIKPEDREYYAVLEQVGVFNGKRPPIVRRALETGLTVEEFSKLVTATQAACKDRDGRDNVGKLVWRLTNEPMKRQRQPRQKSQASDVFIPGSGKVSKRSAQ
jgi:hypothetical protein